MPIVTHTIRQHAQADGRISYVLRLFDQDGGERLAVGLVPAGTDFAALVATKTAEADAQLAAEEFNALVGA